MSLKAKRFFISLFLALQMIAVSAFAAGVSPIGNWKTIDDKTGNAKSIVRISGSSGGISGTVVKLFPGALTVCSACSGNLKDKPILGMTVMHGLKQDSSNPNEWSGGSIMDPKTGKVYRCTLTVSADGKTMTVRGYVGISLFGRSQTWIKVGK
jgi:uncharacterized protein (DUF2147 family)